MNSWGGHMEILDILYGNSLKVYMQDWKCTQDTKKYHINLFQIYSAIELFISSLLKQLCTQHKIFFPLFVAIFRKIFVGSNKLDVSAQLPHLHQSFPPQNLSADSLIELLLLSLIFLQFSPYINSVLPCFPSRADSARSHNGTSAHTEV